MLFENPYVPRERCNLNLTISIVLSFILAAASFLVQAREQDRSLQISLVIDGPGQHPFVSIEEVKTEVTKLVGNDASITFTPLEQTTANWTLKSIRSVLDRQFTNPKVTMVITLGAISSNELAKRARYSKPSIAAITVNPSAQGFPIKGNVSAKKNFTYIADVKGAAHEVEFFRDFVQAKSIALLVEPLLSESWPELDDLLASAAKEYAVKFQRIDVTRNIDNLIQSIPNDVDAVMVGVLSQYTNEDVGTLARKLIERKLPSYSFIGELGVEAGFLVSINQTRQSKMQIARRIAINVQKIVLGRVPEKLNVQMRFADRIIYNQATGFAIGFAPTWDDLRNAKLVNQTQIGSQQAFSIEQAVTYALDNNLSLAADRLVTLLAKYRLNYAKRLLWPQLALGASYRQVNKEQAFPIINPEQRGDAELSLQQVLYSEALHAQVDVEQLQLKKSLSDYQTQVLDLIQQCANTYVALLRAKAAEDIRRANQELTRKNLELAQNRRLVGVSGLSDILRWQSQLALDKRNSLSAEATRKQAELELSRLLNLPEKVRVDTEQPRIKYLLDLVNAPRVKKWLSNEILWERFQKFFISEARANSTTLQAIKFSLEGQRRNLLANKRADFIPELSAFAKASRFLHQSGAGAVDDIERNNWTVGIQAKWELDLAGTRRQSRTQLKLGIEQIRLQYRDLDQRVSNASAQALVQVASSYPSIELAHTSAKAASDSLKLVRNAYGNGRVSISELLDAQNNALSAKLLAADAEYQFLADFIDLMRSASDFSPLLKGDYNDNWYKRLESFFQG